MDSSRTFEIGLSHRSTKRRARPSEWWCCVVLLLIAGCSADSGASETHNWESDWEIDGPFGLEIAATGFDLPTSLAFVPQPGSERLDPLYFVSELRGKIKVVSNDASVSTFAEVPALMPTAELPEGEGQGGLGALCLDGENGYVFATYTHRDADGVLRNRITRFSADPGGFSTTHSGETTFDGPLSDERSALSHQIGGCLVDDEALYIGVGDGGDPGASRDTQRLLGKILRMTLDGAAHPDNPLYDPANPDAPAGYVYAWGVRNPFGLDVVDGRLFATDNGPSVDRFIEIEAGADYQWRGNDWSMGLSGGVVMSPPISPVQVDHYEPASAPEELRDEFLMAAAGATDGAASAGVVRVAFDEDHDQPQAPPIYVVTYSGPVDLQNVAALAVGPDAVYFAPLLPDPRGETYVIRMVHDPNVDQEDETGTAEALIVEYGCLACHRLDGTGGGVGPSLEDLDFRLEDRLESEGYLAKLDEVDELDTEPFTLYAEERQRLREVSGHQRVALWTQFRIMEPRFDDPDAQMPDLGVSREEAEVIAEFLVGESVDQNLRERLLTVGSSPFRSALILAVVGASTAFLAGVAVASAVVVIRGWRRQTADTPPEEHR